MVYTCYRCYGVDILLLYPQGNKCPFRHSAAALGTEEVCDLWLKGQCNRKICAFRHSIVDVSIVCVCVRACVRACASVCVSVCVCVYVCIK